MVDPHDIERVEFSTTRLKAGYDPDEVDNYLDRVADTLRSKNESLNKANDEIVILRRRVAELERVANDTPTSQLPVFQSEPTAAAGRLLELAQKTADDVIAQAQAEAVGIQQRADENARDTLNQAVEEAHKRKRAAEAEAYKAEQDLDLLTGVRKSVRAQLEAQLRDLHNKLGDPA
jgi:DivIVA domain-containing protein